MLVQKISIDSILTYESRFCLHKLLFGNNQGDEHLTQSLKNFGILSPVIVAKDSNNRLHLIDGMKRLIFAKKNQIKEIHAVVLDETMPINNILTILLYNMWHRINESPINKIQFVWFAHSSGASRQWITGVLCREFGFKPHSSFIEECMRIYNLPWEFKTFCHEKKLPLKLILNVSHYPEEIISQLMKWRHSLHLTASFFGEIASNIKDYLRFNNKTMEEFASESCIQEIFTSPLNPRERTERLRQYIVMKRYPVLTETNKRIQTLVNNINIPEKVTVNWDKTLEIKGIDIKIHLSNIKEWEEIKKRLISHEIKDLIKDILEAL
jgi:hypothetical protein